MTKLTETQIEFLVDTFFMARVEYAGALSIAQTLIKNGQCIVAGTTNGIWVGGVGNFITVKDAPGAWGCSIYTLDLQSFLSSGFARDIINDCLLKKEDKVLKLKNEINTISNLISLSSENDLTPKNN